MDTKSFFYKKIIFGTSTSITDTKDIQETDPSDNTLHIQFSHIKNFTISFHPSSKETNTTFKKILIITQKGYLSWSYTSQHKKKPWLFQQTFPHKETVSYKNPLSSLTLSHALIKSFYPHVYSFSNIIDNTEFFHHSKNFIISQQNPTLDATTKILELNPKTTKIVEIKKIPLGIRFVITTDSIENKEKEYVFETKKLIFNCTLHQLNFLLSHNNQLKKKILLLLGCKTPPLMPSWMHFYAPLSITKKELHPWLSPYFILASDRDVAPITDIFQFFEVNSTLYVKFTPENYTSQTALFKSIEKCISLTKEIFPHIHKKQMLSHTKDLFYLQSQYQHNGYFTFFGEEMFFETRRKSNSKFHSMKSNFFHHKVIQ